MDYKAKFLGWQSVSLDDLLVAYRKAKADCFFENTFPTAIKFAEFERDLVTNLERVRRKLRDENRIPTDWLGEPRILPKKLTIHPIDECSAGHVHFSDPERAFEDLQKKNRLTPEFRIVGDFPVEAHVVSALWINCVGHKFDAALSKECYGARLRRVQEETLEPHAYPDFHVSAIGSFKPYFGPYQRWRRDGFDAIRSELEKDRDVIAVSLDLKSYYHLIDPSFLVSDDLLSSLRITLEPPELQFCVALSNFLSRWATRAKQFSKKFLIENVQIPGGLVIGLTATRIISNVLLHRWDMLINEKISPVHYGRYVDDMFIVIRDPGNIRGTDDFMCYLQARMGSEFVFVEKDEAAKSIAAAAPWNLFLGQHIQGKSRIRVQPSKQKLFVLHGRAGLDLLDSIEKEIRDLSSEHRLMPSPDQLEKSTAARVLSAAAGSAEQADNLRRADGLTIRRLSWSLQLRHVETLGRDLPAHEWVVQRREFYQFAHNHILRPDGLFAHFIYLPRLLGFAIRQNDWYEAERIVLKSKDSIARLASAISADSRIEINGVQAKGNQKLWRFVEDTLIWMFVDAAARYYDPDRLRTDDRVKKENRLADLFIEGILGQITDVKDFFEFDAENWNFYKIAPRIAAADLAKDPYKRILNTRSAAELVVGRESRKENTVLRGLSKLIDTDALEDFLASSRNSRTRYIRESRKVESRMPYLFPTRPLTPAEIAELAPECVGLPRSDGKVSADLPAATWARYTQSLRGVWVKPTLLAVEQDQGQSKKSGRGRSGNNLLHIGTERKKALVVALTSLRTEDSDWAAMVSGKPNHSIARYSRISALVNQTIRLDPKPDIVILPELSLPLAWVGSVSSRLAAAGISLVAGTEYRHFNGDQILSEACLVLSDNRLGYPAWVRIWQPKLEPAVGEDRELTSKFGKSWAIGETKFHKRKPIYVHNGVHFGVMVCSELQNGKARMKFQGDIDSLVVLSWNQDLDTFSALVEAAALDMHAYVVLANNRKYGDSRIRSPGKEVFMRDLARLRGGENDFVVAARLDIDALRAFQSRAKRWPEATDKFKPVPEGYRMHSHRKRLPPS